MQAINKLAYNLILLQHQILSLSIIIRYLTVHIDIIQIIKYEHLFDYNQILNYTIYICN